MNLFHHSRFFVILLAISAANGHPSYGQDSAWIAGTKQILVVVRDAVTQNLVSKPTLRVKKAELTSEEYRSALIGESDDGMFRLRLGRGKYKLLITAEGYLPLIVTGCDIPTGSEAYGVSCGMSTLLYVGKLFIFSAFLQPRAGNPEQNVTQPFISDTLHYAEPEEAPIPVGGMKALKKKIDVSRLGGSVLTGGRMTELDAAVYIEQDGSVSRVSVTGTGNLRVCRMIEDALKGARFTPAKILGIPVKSEVNVPFRIAREF